MLYCVNMKKSLDGVRCIRNTVINENMYSCHIALLIINICRSISGILCYEAVFVMFIVEYRSDVCLMMIVSFIVSTFKLILVFVIRNSQVFTE